LLPIRLPKVASPRAGSHWLQEVKEGFNYIGTAPLVLASILTAYGLSIFVGTYQRFLPMFAKDILRVGPDGLGLLMAASGVGAILSLLFLDAAGRRWRQDTLLWFSASATPLVLILFCVSRNLWLSVLLMGLLGSAQVLFRTVSRLVIQVEAPRELLGRVMSIFLMDQGLRSVGSMVMGAFATVFGPALGLSFCSIVSMALTAVTFYKVLMKRTLAASKRARQNEEILTAADITVLPAPPRKEAEP
jgi:predicted MFS family arabinose efflux permease